VPGKDEDILKRLDLPWITKEGYLDLKKFPIDSILKQAVAKDEKSFCSACRMLGSMSYAGRKEAAVFLYGLLKFCEDDIIRKQSVVEALCHVKTKQTAGLLFEELERTESSSSTRGYITTILNALRFFTADLVEDGFQRLLSDRRWSYRMKQKFREILEEVENRRLRQIT